MEIRLYNEGNLYTQKCIGTVHGTVQPTVLLKMLKKSVTITNKNLQPIRLLTHLKELLCGVDQHL